MAKRKGKSRHRHKDWHQRYQAGEDLIETRARRGSMSTRGVKLPAWRLAEQEENLDQLDRVRGVVASMYRGGAEVRLADGRRVLCGIAKAFRPPDENATAITPGDEVTVALSRAEHVDGDEQADRDRADGMIVSRQPRDTLLCRPMPWSARRRGEYDQDVPVKVIAANMDRLLIVAATRKPRLRRALIDRFMIVAERGELEPMLVVNKIDVAPADPAILGEFAELGLRSMAVSAATGEGIDDLRANLQGHRAVLAGASGVGKSTLINALIPDADAATRTVRAKDERGRHTTSSTELYDLPGGGLLMDTPGIRELGLNMDAGELWWYFPDFEDPAAHCRFGDCTHTHEPGCGVQQAVRDGAINPRRYDSYLRIFDSLTDRQG